ncbi:MAG TPA: NHL repeat-containing protein [bacterium]|nr:NHL repeat-containing protein [bacterium]
MIHRRLALVLGMGLGWAGAALAQTPTPDCCMGLTQISGLNGPAGMAIDPARDRLYVTDRLNNYLRVYTEAGAPVTAFNTWSGGGFNQLQDVALDDQGNVYVADYSNYVVEKFSSGLSFSATIINLWPYDLPRGIWVEDQGVSQSVFIASQYGHIYRYDGAGTSYSAAVTFGTGLNTPTGLEKKGNMVYVADTVNNRVVVFDASSAYSAAATYSFDFPYFIHTDTSGQFYVTEAASTQRLNTFPNGLGGARTTCPVPNGAAGIAVNGLGNVFVSEINGSAVTLLQGCDPGYTPTPHPVTGNFFIYPSPVRGDQATVSYEMAEPGRMDLRVWNEKAEIVTRVTEQKLSGTQISPISVAGFRSGVYFYMVTLHYDSGREEKLGPKKFIVLH